MGPFYCYDTCLNLVFPLRGACRWLEQAAELCRRVQVAMLRQTAPPPATSCGKSIFGIWFQWEKHKNIFGNPSLPLLAAKVSAFDNGGSISFETKTALIKTLVDPHFLFLFFFSFVGKKDDLLKHVIWTCSVKFHDIKLAWWQLP